MEKDEIRFCITLSELVTPLFARGEVLSTADGWAIYRVEFFNGVNVYVASSGGKRLSNGKYRRELWIFDKKCTIEYGGNWELVLTVVDSDDEYVRFNVEADTTWGRAFQGVLIVHKDGAIRFKEQDISSVEICRKYTKACVLGAGINA